MIARLAMLWNRLKNSLWALPITFVIAATILALLVVYQPLNPRNDPVWWLYSGDAPAASGFLANLLTAMITMATLAISITMVVLTLAAQSLGPRLIPIFMSDTRTKLMLGLFIGTVVYLLIVLRSVVGDIDRVPNLAVTLGAALVFISVVVLLFFVHHLARSIVADTIVDRVGDTLDSWIPGAFPEKTNASPPSNATGGSENDGHPFAAMTTGYVQAIDHESAISAARAAGAAVTLSHRPGHYVLRGDVLARITPASALNDELADTLKSCIVCGNSRTPVQDIEYPIRQLVEIALRALSPGINDPYTACAVIDRVTGSIARIMARGVQQSRWYDEEEIVRLIVPTTQIDGILDAAFNEIRQAGASQPAILIRLVDRLGQLLGHANNDQAEEIRRHLELVRATGQRGIADQADRSILAARIETALT